MLNVITGYGPRVGSSFIMRQAKIRGLDVKGTKYFHGQAPVSGNPGGYYDLTDPEVLMLRDGVGKVWPRQMRLLRQVPDRLVVLERRDMEAWVESIEKQIRRENGSHTPQQVLEFTIPLMDQCLDDFPGDIMKVHTEDLNECIEDILEFIGE